MAYMILGRILPKATDFASIFFIAFAWLYWYDPNRFTYIHTLPGSEPLYSKGITWKDAYFTTIFVSAVASWLYSSIKNDKFIWMKALCIVNFSMALIVYLLGFILDDSWKFIEDWKRGFRERRPGAHNIQPFPERVTIPVTTEEPPSYQEAKSQ